MKKKLVIVALLSLIMAFASCGKKDSPEGSSGSGSSYLSGNWKYICWSSVDSSNFYQHSYTDTVFTYISKFYSDTSCSTLSFELNGTFNYTIGADISVTQNNTNLAKTAKKLDRTLITSTITPKTQTAVDAFNTDSACGYNDWQLNIPKSVLGKTCAFKVNTTTFNYIFGASGIKSYSSVLVESNKIYYGVYSADAPLNDGTTDAKRHSYISDLYYTKQ